MSQAMDGQRTRVQRDQLWSSRRGPVSCTIALPFPYIHHYHHHDYSFLCRQGHSDCQQFIIISNYHSPLQQNHFTIQIFTFFQPSQRLARRKSVNTAQSHHIQVNYCPTFQIYLKYRSINYQSYFHQSWKMSNLLHGPISTNQILPRDERINRNIFGTSNLQNKTYGVSCGE